MDGEIGKDREIVREREREIEIKGWRRVVITPTS